ncbi:MAG: GntR family transcriptional regulator [Xylophilus ampelinus]
MNRLSEQLREAIEEEIATGRLLPGTHLDETALAQRYGVSRTPIREALSLLAGEGLVEARPRRGAVVAQVTAQRLIEMFEVMAELEALCARQAARRMTDADLREVEAAHEACRAAAAGQDPDAYFYANEDFHRRVYLSSHNGYLSEQAQALQRKLRPYRRLQLRVRNRIARSIEEHETVMQALRRGDGDASAAAMRSHVVVQGERFADLLASLAQLEGAPAAAAPEPAARAARETARA